MTLTRNNQRVFHRILYAGQIQRITLLKRNDDLQEGTVQALTMFQCWKSRITKTGEQIAGGMQSEHRTIWNIPRVELNRVGVTYINGADRIVDNQGRYWQPESTTEIEIRLMEDEVKIQCLRIDPPGSNFVA